MGGDSRSRVFELYRPEPLTSWEPSTTLGAVAMAVFGGGGDLEAPFLQRTVSGVHKQLSNLPTARGLNLSSKRIFSLLHSPDPDPRDPEIVEKVERCKRKRRMPEAMVENPTRRGRVGACAEAVAMHSNTKRPPPNTGKTKPKKGMCAIAFGIVLKEEGGLPRFSPIILRTGQASRKNQGRSKRAEKAKKGRRGGGERETKAVIRCGYRATPHHGFRAGRLSTTSSCPDFLALQTDVSRRIIALFAVLVVADAVVSSHSLGRRRQGRSRARTHSFPEEAGADSD